MKVLNKHRTNIKTNQFFSDRDLFICIVKPVRTKGIVTYNMYEKRVVLTQQTR